MPWYCEGGYRNEHTRSQYFDSRMQFSTTGWCPFLTHGFHDGQAYEDSSLPIQCAVMLIYNGKKVDRVWECCTQEIC